MVYRKRSRKRSRKKRSFKKRYRRKSRISRQLVPNRCAKTLNYSTSLTLDPTISGVPATHMFVMNGLYNPDFTTQVFDHQPMGFDQYCPVLYTHYTVVGFKITATFLSTTSGTEVGSARVGITPTGRSTTSLSTGVDTMIEQGRSRHKIMTNSIANGKSIVTYSCNPNKFLGVSQPLGNSTVKGTSQANPSEACYAHVWAGAIDSSTDVAPIKVLISIQYKAVFSEPRWLEQS